MADRSKEGRYKEEETRGAGREKTGGEIRRYRHRVKGRDRDGQTLMERQRDTQKQADAPRQTGRHIPERQADTYQRDSQSKAGGQRSTEEPGPPKPSGHPEMEQKAVGGGGAELRTGETVAW